MSSVFGERLKVALFGQSHSEAVGVCIDGLPSGIKINMEQLKQFLQRRAAKGDISRQRREPDIPEFLSGLNNDYTCGAPISVIIRNTDVKSADYNNLRDTPRPSHADYAAKCRFGDYTDQSGGGHFSGRITAALCIAGGICIQYLESLGIRIGAHIYSVADIKDRPFDPVGITAQQLNIITQNEFPVIDKNTKKQIMERIVAAKNDGDSLGGIIEFAVVGVSPGVGAPHFGGLENKISSAAFGVPAVKGIEFGNGFACTELTGSKNNDAFYVENGVIKTKTNNSGGIIGGMSNGMPLIGRVAVKPTPSISKQQDSVNLKTKENVKLNIKGRHDPCILHRAVPCIESAVAIALTDCILCDKN